MTQFWHNLSLTIQRLFGLKPVTVVNLIFSLLVIFLFVGAKRIFVWYANRQIKDDNKRHMAIKTMHYLSVIIAFVIIGIIWFGGGTGFAAYFGILSAGLAIALQDLLVNIAGCNMFCS